MQYLKSNFKVPYCTAEHLNCVSSIKFDHSDCLQQCSGILVTSFYQDRLSNVESEMSRMVEYMSRQIHVFRNLAKEFKGSHSDAQSLTSCF